MEVVFVICFLMIICFMFGYFIGHTKGFNECEEIYEKYSVTTSKGYNDAIDDVIKLVDDDLTFDIGMDMYVERDLLCEKLEKLRI